MREGARGNDAGKGRRQGDEGKVSNGSEMCDSGKGSHQ